MSANAHGATPAQIWFETQDTFVASDIESDEQGSYFYVSLKSLDNRIYMSYNFDIIMPYGVTFPVIGQTTEYEIGDIWMDEDSPIYPYTTSGRPAKKTFSHTLSNSIKDNGSRAKVICYSNTNADFLETGGSLCGFAVEIHPLAKAGENIVKFRDMVFAQNNPDGGDPIEWAPHNVLHNVLYSTINIPAERTVKVEIPADKKWGTVILPFVLETLPDGVTAYKASAINSYNEVELEAATRLEAYKPYLINAPQGWSATLSGIASEEDFPSVATFDSRAYVDANGVVGEDDYADEFPTHAIASHGVLQANMRHHELTDGYLLTVDGDTPTFTRVDASAPQTLSTGDVFIAAKDGVDASSLPLRVTVDTASPVVAADAAPQPVYDLQGRLTAPRDGEIYITAGQKRLNSH